MGKQTSAKIKNTIGNHPRGPGKCIQRWNGCAPVRTMCRALAKTSTHFKTRTSMKYQSSRYPKSAPPREEKTSSPTPIVSDAITAPGPKIASQRNGLRERSEGGSAVDSTTSDCEFTRGTLEAASPITILLL